MGTAQASGIALVVAARRGLPIALHTPSEVKAAVSGSGRADKAQVGAMVTRILRLDATPQARRRRRRAGAGHHPHLARWRPGPHRRRARRGPTQPDQRPEDPMIAFVRGEVAAVTLDQRRARGRRRRPRADVHARHPGHAARRPRGDAADQHGGARGLADPLRLPRRRREADLRARPDRLRRRPQGRPGDASRCSPRRPAPRHRDRGRQDPDPGARASARRAPSGSSSSSRTASGPRSAAPPRRTSGAAPAAPWRDQVHQGLVGLGWSAKEAEQAVDAGRRPRPATTPDVGALLRAALRTLSKA